MIVSKSHHVPVQVGFKIHITDDVTQEKIEYKIVSIEDLDDQLKLFLKMVE